MQVKEPWPGGLETWPLGSPSLPAVRISSQLPVGPRSVQLPHLCRIHRLPQTLQVLGGREGSVCFIWGPWSLSLGGGRAG